MKKHIVLPLVLFLVCSSLVSCQSGSGIQRPSGDTNRTTPLGATSETTCVTAAATSAEGEKKRSSAQTSNTEVTTVVSPITAEAITLPDITSSPVVTTVTEPITTTAITESAITESVESVPATAPETTAAPVPQHAHAFGNAWESDNTNHWHVCSCGETTGTAAHSFAEWITDSEPTCTAEGLRHRVCSVCGRSVSEAIPAKGHTPVTDAGTPVTCTASGLSAGTHCAVCQAVLTAQSPISANGHTPVTDAGFPATCTTVGMTDGSHCAVCQAILTEQRLIPATGHTPVTDAGIPATCTAAGLTAGTHCAVCQAVLTEQRSIPAKGHTPVTDAGIPATCAAAGLTEGSHCSVCQAVLTAQRPIPAKEHTPVTDAAVSPTCTAKGKTEGSHCGVCNAVVVAQQEIPALGHNFVNLVCTRCGRREYSAGLTYAESDYGDGWRVSGLGSCTDTDIIIPSVYQGRPVLEIGQNFCKNRTDIQFVSIPDTVVAIDAYAFYGCTGLTEFVVPSSVIVLADGALYGCTGIKELSVPASVLYIGVDTIKNSGIETLYYYSDCQPLNSQMANIKKAVFGGTLVPDYFFENATKLTEVTLASSITRIGVSAFAGCSSLRSIQIPNSVTLMFHNAFDVCSSLKSAILSENCKIINDETFKNCSSLEVVYMPGKLELVKSAAFEGCTNLRTFNYAKRTDQWQYEVMKNSGWDTNTGNFEVVCSNGTLTKTQAEVNYTGS